MSYRLEPGVTSFRLFDLVRESNNPRFLDIEFLSKKKIRVRVTAKNGYKTLVLAKPEIEILVTILAEYLKEP